MYSFERGGDGKGKDVGVRVSTKRKRRKGAAESTDHSSGLSYLASPKFPKWFESSRLGQMSSFMGNKPVNSLRTLSLAALVSSPGILGTSRWFTFTIG